MDMPGGVTRFPMAWGGATADLRAVFAERPDNVWLVGSDGAGQAAWHWNGRHWTGHHPFGESDDFSLMDVAASGRKAWFVGSSSSGGFVAERDGHAFRSLRSDVGGAYSVLEAISVKDGHLWAVGAVGDTSAPNTPLIYGMSVGDDGPVRSPVPEITLGELIDVEQTSPSQACAVGILHAHIDYGDRPLMLCWDGSKWSRVQAPFAHGQLLGITAGEGGIWISGINFDHLSQAAFLHPTGTAWISEYSTPHTGKPENNDVLQIKIAGTPGTTTLWSAGASGSGDDDGTTGRHFILRR
jgi:hypothetical protein